MLKIKSLLVLTTLLISSSVVFAADAALTADNQSINSACSGDAATAGCGGEQVGKGLLKCLHAYKKANKSFKFSDACKAAMKQRHADKQAGK